MPERLNNDIKRRSNFVGTSVAEIDAAGLGVILLEQDHVGGSQQSVASARTRRRSSPGETVAGVRRNS